jgi:hypothetical protein
MLFLGNGDNDYDETSSNGLFGSGESADSENL